MNNILKISTLNIIIVALFLVACNKEPYMPNNPATYIGFSNAKYGADNDDQPLLSSLKVMTYNIHYGEPVNNVDTTNLGAIVQAIRKGNADVIVLQEVDNGTNRNGYTGNQAEVLADSLKMNFFFYSARQYLRGLYGIAILSKYPLKNIRKYDLTRENDATEQRVLGTALVDLPGIDSVTIAVTHLQHNSATNRLQQVNDIVNHLSKVNGRLIIGGDFNELENATNFFSIFDGTFTRTCVGGNCAKTFPAQNPTATIDYLAFKPANAFTVKNHATIFTQNASDHLPVVAELIINR